MWIISCSHAAVYGIMPKTRLGLMQHDLSEKLKHCTVLCGRAKRTCTVKYQLVLYSSE